MQPKELTPEEMRDTNGGGLANGNDSSLQVGIQLGVTMSHTDEDGNTESRSVNGGFGNSTEADH